MFVPRAASRNPKRRPRTSSEDSVKPPKAKRQRSILRQVGDSNVTSLNRDDKEESVAPILVNEHDATADALGVDCHLPIRNTKPSEISRNEPEGTVVLSSTHYYTVDQFPSLPDQLRGLQSDPLRCFFGPGHEYALALTSSHAIVWPYSVSTSAPTLAEIFTVSIPESYRDPKGAVPLGVLLSTATGEHPGLLVIVPSTGKIIYWETVSSAASLGLSRQKQNGIQGFTPGLFSGEYATEIMNCEPSGIIATFSSGRVAHISLRDSQGKPSVLVNFLRSTVGSGGGGILGGLKSVLGGGSWRKEVTAVRAGGSRQRGQRDVIIATLTGLVEIWDTHWHHGNALKKKFDVKDAISAAISHGTVDFPREMDLKIMDFAFSVQQSNEESGSQDTEESWRLFLVVGSPQLFESKTLFVVQLFLSGGETRVTSTHAVDIRSISTTQDEPKPKILVSKSEDTAFILIEHSIIILSLSSIEETPSLQLLLDSQKIPMSFQDIIHLRSGKENEILGYGSEDRSENENATCVMMIRNFGVVRVNVIPQHLSGKDLEEQQLTAKDKLEQAIFFGTMARNPLNLIDDSGLDFPASDIEQASLEICRSFSAMNDLASLLSRKSNPLSRSARWELLWAAEKLSAQKAMWNLEELHRASNENPLLGHVIESMNDKFKTRPELVQSEIDPVRQWFLRDTYQMEHIIPWIKSTLKHRRGNSSKQARKLSEQILEASEIFLAIMETAFRYRDEHAALYGLSDDFVEDGVLADGYEGLPEFWTSREMGYTEAGHLLDLELDSCRAWSQQKTSTADAPEDRVLKKIADNSARHLRVLGQMHRERARWLGAQDDQKLADASELDIFKMPLAWPSGSEIWGALVELIIELQDEVKTQPAQETLRAGASALADNEADVVHRISQYFDKFGEPWADAYFARQISMGHPGALLSMRKYQSSVTRFLRKSPAYSKLSWINDVAGEDDYNSAASCLEKLALGSEKELWNHRVEISLAKLSKLASYEKSSGDSNLALQEDIKHLDDYSEIDEIQDTLYSYIKPVLEGAIDRKAEAELALDYFGGHLVNDRPSLHEVLGEALSTLVNRKIIGADGSIDLLTLMGPLQPSDDWDSEFRGQEFFQALRVLDHSRFAQQDPSYITALRKLIWRRCLIKDNWAARGKAAEESNGHSVFAARDTALGLTLTSCLAEQSTTNIQSIYIPLSPAEAIMADYETDILLARFRPEQKARLSADLERENELLHEYIEIGKLDFWFQNLLSSIGSQTSGSVPESGDALADSLALVKPRRDWREFDES
ncbi:uncharacterized protein N7477_008050 [Penicillium maclennaniae]|uniref:uncharacterized protein n=1 Tax=Penicillium maclennaniae TaxID=1343394 RepID=UPI0025402E99|nr:uncharacterized protein N7477_008050 [Penicillium maclennaniae]KAJ5665602.1 hypothetical protein N7477_008050 [Penicillium maclennaniae]